MKDLAIAPEIDFPSQEGWSPQPPTGSYAYGCEPVSSPSESVRVALSKRFGVRTTEQEAPQTLPGDSDE